MDFNMTESVCNKCIGDEECGKYCALHAGHALYNFLRKIDITETKIGNYESTVKGGIKDLVVSGHKVWEVENPSSLLTNINTILSTETKINGMFNMTPTKLLLNYCKTVGIEKSEIDSLSQVLGSLTKNRVLVLSLKPHMDCEIVVEKSNEVQKAKSEKHENIEANGTNGAGTNGTNGVGATGAGETVGVTGTAGGKQKKKKDAVEASSKHKTRYKFDDAKVIYLAWRTNKETHKLECTVAFKTGSKEKDKVYTYSMTDYMKYFRVKSTEYVSTIDFDMIQMTNYGIIKPISVTDGKTTVAIDGSYVYDVQGQVLHIIGRWSEKGELRIDKTSKTKPLKKIIDNLIILKNHRKYIAPYMLHECNNIEI